MNFQLVISGVLIELLRGRDLTSFEMFVIVTSFYLILLY